MLQVFRFTSQFSIVAVGAQVVNGTTPRPGPADAVGYFNYGINAAEDTICYVRPPLLFYLSLPCQPQRRYLT